MTLIKYEVRVAPGCYGGPSAPLVSAHRTLAAAVRAARCSDRVVVTRSDSTACLWRAPSRQQSALNQRYGAGLYGAGPQRGEPTLRDLLDSAEVAS